MTSGNARYLAVAALGAAIVLHLAVDISAAQVSETDVPPNPFAGIETIILSNGLRVWFKNLPHDPNVSISVNIPYGSGDDPPGLEELAHFLEHMLFSDHLGRTEEQIKAEIEDLGGYRNGLTYVDHTYYLAQVEGRHAQFAIDWLYRLVSPHAMEPEIVDRQRTPIIVELNARPRGFFDWIQARYIDPPALRLQGWWEREFGISTRRSRDYYPYRSLHAITPNDLHWFYDTYYVPSRMTLMVVGSVDREATLATLQETFATLPARTEPEPRPPLSDPERPYRSYLWTDRADAHYSRDFKVYRPTSRDQMMVQFLAAHLHRNLRSELRYGERKAVYGMSVGTRLWGEAASLYINGRIKKEELAFARNVIDEEIRNLRDGTLSEDAFLVNREAITMQWRRDCSTARDLASWFQRFFYNPDRFQDYPDMVAFAEGLSRDELVAFAQAHLVPKRETFFLTRPLPLRLEILIVIWVLLMWLVVKLSGKLLVRPVDMSKIRYVARFRLSLVNRIVGGALFVLVIAVFGRLYFYGASYLYYHHLTSIDNFWIQSICVGLIWAFGGFLFVLALSLVPYKLLVFEDHLRIKYLWFRSRILRPEDLVSLSSRRFHEIYLTKRCFGSLLLTLGLIKPGLHLRLRKGPDLFFQVRRPAEVRRALDALGLAEKVG